MGRAHGKSNKIQCLFAIQKIRKMYKFRLTGYTINNRNNSTTPRTKKRQKILTYLILTRKAKFYRHKIFYSL